MFYGHGLRKFNKLFGDEEITFADPFGLGPVPSLALGCSSMDNLLEAIVMKIILSIIKNITTAPMIDTAIITPLLIFDAFCFKNSSDSA